ncbi:phage terminase large subunit family protein [Paracoccus aestuariivivens]|uniref:Phage terminase large subunit family protein n=1 Tax=Paracoccus aestuariivivens TaxID=1820333 RepID=A0A6L6JBA5_9RHOB|nr:phage terminase large subunit family protein [Paracoccus aestuariivivens]MTH79412.1 phage terminase large subunit family protein [Paracoccus aestuariivivens]
MTVPFGNASQIARAVALAQRHLRPPPTLKPSEYAEQSVRIPEGNAVPGLIRFDNAPFQREPLDMTINSACRRITLMWGAQVGKTTLALCAQSYRIEQNPTSQMMMQPSQGDLGTWMQTKFNPMVEANPALQKLIAPPRGRKGVNNDKMKSYPGGFIMFSWAGSPKTMRGRSAPFIVCDETDGYDRVTEGHPVNLLAQRAASFGDDGFLLEISTPGIKGASWIEAAFLAGDRRRFHVCCPHCGHQQTLKWANVTWDKDDEGEHLPETARYRCDAHDPETGEILCGKTWNDGQRWAAIRSAERDGAGWIAERPFRGHASYHLSELYSCFRRLSHIVQSFLDKVAANDMQSFTNISLAETWELEGEQVDATSLMGRVEAYAAPVPDGALVLTAGIDMQQDRLEVEVVGWGLGEESWTVEHRVIYGDPMQRDVWDDLDAMLAETWQHENGDQLSIASACLDTGGSAGMTQAAYEYARGKTGRRLFAVKGMSGFGRPIVSTPTRKASGRRARKVDLFPVGVDEAKVVVTRRLGIMRPGPGYCHFHNGLDPEYFAQMTSEKLVTKMTKGFAVREWHKTRDRNEVFDCRVYATAALKLLNPNFARLAKRMAITFPPAEADEPEPAPAATVGKTAAKLVDAIQQVRQTRAAPDPVEIPPEEPEAPDPQSAPKSVRRARRRRTGGGWVNRW